MSPLDDARETPTGCRSARPSLHREPRPHRPRAHTRWLASLFAATATACVLQEYDSAKEMRAEYDACVTEHSETHRDCQVLWEAYQTEIARYEASSRRAWACDPAQEECPTRR